MDNLATQIRVGIFTLVGLVITLISIILLGGDRFLFKAKTDLFVQFEQVQGLVEGSVVSLSGIVIGNVKEITIDSIGQETQANKSAGRLLVRIQIEEAFLSKIRKDSTIEIRTQGALGDKFIYITPGSLGSTPVAANSVIESSKPSDFMGVLAERGSEAGKVFEIIEEIQVLTKAMNEGKKIPLILSNLATASENFKVSSLETQLLMSDLRKKNVEQLSSSLEKLDRILGKVDRGEGTLGALINDPSLHESLKSLTGSNSRSKNMRSLIRTSIEGNQ